MEGGRSKESKPCRAGTAGGVYVKRSLITGITCQAGSYLAELLLSKGYEVHGLIGRSSTFSTCRRCHSLAWSEAAAETVSQTECNQ